MGKRRKHVSKKEDFLMISKRIKPSSTKTLKILQQIPLDLIIQILTKLPAKSFAKFRCVSKEWNLILRSPNFSKMFLKVSSSRPRFLFAVRTMRKWLFYSAPQDLNLDNNYSSTLTTNYYMSCSLTPCFPHLLDPVNGLFCIQQGCKTKVTTFNPSTGQSIPLLRMTGSWRDDAFHFFGYDPINEQYKVLCLSMRGRNVLKYHVLTLGIQKPVWKMIECSLPQHYPYSPICFNGVLYYLISNHEGRETLVCFEVMSEKFRFIETNEKVIRSSMLINYKGKLDVLPPYRLFDGNSRSIEFLVLDDDENKEWLQHIYVLPPLWKDLVEDMRLYIVGMTCNGELVFSKYEQDPFYIFFYNMEKNTIARVRIQGLESTEPLFIQTFIDHVENVKLI